VGIFVLASRLQLAPARRLLLTASFTLATVALPYARHVNNHTLLLAVMCGLVLDVAGLHQDAHAGIQRWDRLLRLGFLSGLTYTIDLGVGPVILLCTAALVVARLRRFRAAAVFALAALPWLALHHALNYAVGGCWRPANAIVEYLAWPGSAFSSGNMT